MFAILFSSLCQISSKLFHATQSSRMPDQASGSELFILRQQLIFLFRFCTESYQHTYCLKDYVAFIFLCFSLLIFFYMCSLC
jgi:hypothetical protein